MKRIILILCLLASLSFSQDYSPIERFVNIVHTDRYGDLEQGVAWVRAPANLLTNTIPVGIKWSAVPTGEMDADGEPITRQKTLDEYLMPHTRQTFEDGTVLFLLCAMESPITRLEPVSRDDLLLFNQYFSAYGFGADKWMTQAEKQAGYTQEIE